MATPNTSNRRPALTGAAAALALLLAGQIIRSFEPPSDPARRGIAYADKLARGIPTACDGHTGPDVKLGMVYSDAQCDAWSLQDRQAALATVNRCLHPPKPLSGHNGGALVSAVYNDGSVIVCGSTLQRLVNSGAPAKIWCPELLKFNKYHTIKMVDGKPVKVYHVSTGLYRRRRTAELPTCLTED